AGEFALWMLPGIPFLYVYEVIRKVSQSRNETVPTLVASVVATSINVVLGTYLVGYTRLGWIGAAVVRTFGNIMLVPTVLVAMMMGLGSVDSSPPTANRETLSILASDGNDCVQQEENDDEFLHHLWEGFVLSEALKPSAVLQFLKLGLPGMLQLMFEWIAFDAITLLCGLLPGREAIVAIGANAVINYTTTVTYMTFLGTSVAGSVRIGNALGAGDVKRAEVASLLTIAVGLVTSLVIMTIFFLFRNSLPLLFTTDAEIVEKAQRIFVIAAIFQVADSLNSSIQGIFRGSGRQMQGAIYNFVGYFVIGIPLEYLLGVQLKFGIEGLWSGLSIGLYSICLLCTKIVLSSDWEALVEATRKRLRSNSRIESDMSRLSQDEAIAVHHSRAFAES
ncbi:hypothetical protein THAOC_16943, partial [Thalassiosira oceanica]